jgi:hypothetical protein
VWRRLHGCAATATRVQELLPFLVPFCDMAQVWADTERCALKQARPFARGLSPASAWHAAGWRPARGSRALHVRHRTACKRACNWCAAVAACGPAGLLAMLGDTALAMLMHAMDTALHWQQAHARHGNWCATHARHTCCVCTDAQPVWCPGTRMQRWPWSAVTAATTHAHRSTSCKRCPQTNIPPSQPSLYIACTPASM